MLALAFGRKVLLDPVLTDGFAQGAIGFAGALLPAGSGFLLAGERFAEEIEVLVVEGLGQVGSRAVNRMPAQIGLPGCRAALKRAVRSAL